MNCNEEQIEKKISTSDVKGWIRTAITVVTVIGSMYYFKGQVDAHIANEEIHLPRATLTDIFVTRREYEGNLVHIKEDITYIRSRLDSITDKIDRIKENRGRFQ